MAGNAGRGDELKGDAGNDWLFAGGLWDVWGDSDTSNNYLNGGDGDDFLFGGDGNDELLGGNDNDRITGNGGNDYIDGGDGIDWVSYAYVTGGVNVSLETVHVITIEWPIDTYAIEELNVSLYFGIATGADGNDILIDVENVEGSGGR